jgi:hypothetical protein
MPFLPTTNELSCGSPSRRSFFAQLLTSREFSSRRTRLSRRRTFRGRSRIAQAVGRLDLPVRLGWIRLVAVQVNRRVLFPLLLAVKPVDPLFESSVVRASPLADQAWLTFFSPSGGDAVSDSAGFGASGAPSVGGTEIYCGCYLFNDRLRGLLTWHFFNSMPPPENAGVPLVNVNRLLKCESKMPT